jgi:hypothetical protein
MSLQDKDVREYFHRSYTAVDGLWFVKVEEKYGFDKALVQIRFFREALCFFSNALIF